MVPVGRRSQGSGSRVQSRKRYRGVLKQIEIRVRALFPDINLANRAVSRLADLSEDMRILSLNAELAAGRAGQSGVAVRALTQYTRGLVRRLVEISDSASGLGQLYLSSTLALRTLRQVRQLEEAMVHVDVFEASDLAHSALDRLDASRNRQMNDVARSLAGIQTAVARLAVMVRVVDDVVSQAASIATNIAAEAVSAGRHEGEFRAVAETMARYVEELRLMSDQAAQGLRGITDGCQRLLEITGGLNRQALEQPAVPNSALLGAA